MVLLIMLPYGLLCLKPYQQKEILLLTPPVAQDQAVSLNKNISNKVPHEVEYKGRNYTIYLTDRDKALDNAERLLEERFTSHPTEGSTRVSDSAGGNPNNLIDKEYSTMKSVRDIAKQRRMERKDLESKTTSTTGV